MQKLMTTTGALILLASVQAVAHPPQQVTVIPGYVSHGINVYNDKPIVDYSQASPLVPWLEPDPLIKEIGVLNEQEGAADATVITEATDRSLPVATTRFFPDFFNPGGAINPDYFNKTLDQIGTNFFGFTNLEQRVPLVPFESAQGTEVYRSKGSLARPTVGDWEKISGQIRIRCRSEGTARARLTIRDAFPNAVYTLWDVGALNPLTPAEQGYGVPFGGLPNILLTDSNGCGYTEVELPTCPTRPCEAGAESCISYVSAFYHWDSQVYGGTPAADFAGAPVGAVAANHIVWPMSGTPWMEPQNKFIPHVQGCPRPKK